MASLCMTLIFWGRFFYDLRIYLEISSPIAAKIDDWAVEEGFQERCRVKVRYSYEAHGHTHVKEVFLNKPFLNAFAAKSYMNCNLSTRVKDVWCDPKNPAKSLFDRTFPWKAMVNALLVGGVLIYFVLLKKYLGKKG